MVIARKVSMQGGISKADAHTHLVTELEDAAVEAEEQRGGPSRKRGVARRRGRNRARDLVARQEAAFDNDDEEGLKAFMMNYSLMLFFLVFPMARLVGSGCSSTRTAQQTAVQR